MTPEGTMPFFVLLALGTPGLQAAVPDPRGTFPLHVSRDAWRHRTTDFTPARLNAG